MRLSTWNSVLHLTALVLLVACGGGDGGGGSGGNPTPVNNKVELTGQFVDSAVAGLKYITSSGLTGATDGTGAFSYKDGDSVSFYLGDILLGEAAGAPLITPVDLVAGATDETNSTVMNIAALLQTLDEDSDPSTGITISGAVFMAAKGKSINFNAVDFATEINNFLNAVFAVVGSTPPTPVLGADAALHLSASLLCGRAGNYAVTYTGDDSGNISFMANPDGSISGTGKSTTSSESPTFTLSGIFTSNGKSEITTTSAGLEFSGTVSLDGTVSGLWKNTVSSTSGEYTGNKTSDLTPDCTPANDTGSGTTTEPGTGTGTGTGSDPTTSTGSSDFGSLTIAGDASFNRNFSEIFSGTKAIATLTGGSGTLFWNEIDSAGIIGAGRALEIVVIDGIPREIVMSGTKIVVISGADQSWSYGLNCTSSDACTNVTLNTDTHEVTFASLVLKVITADESNLATADITLNGVLTYPAP